MIIINKEKLEISIFERLKTAQVKYLRLYLRTGLNYFLPLSEKKVIMVPLNQRLCSRDRFGEYHV